MKVLVIDNYDSFVYNLVHMIQELGTHEVEVVKNDKITLSEVETYDKILLSPGPGIPLEAGKLMEIIEQYYTRKSILGVCLGHQAIGEFLGAQLMNLHTPLHGISSTIKIKKSSTLFQGIPNILQVGHYHSWVIDPQNIPNELQVTAQDSQNNIMAIEHTSLPLFGVQFHPESILTQYGHQMIANWLNQNS